MRLERGLRQVASHRMRGSLARCVDDAVQEALLVVSQKLDTVEDHVDRYAYQCLRNKIHHVYRDPRNTVAETDERDTLDLAPPPDPLLRGHMEEAAGGLSRSDQELLAMLARGMRPGEIAELTPGTKPNAVYQRVHRCLKRYRANLAERGVTV